MNNEEDAQARAQTLVESIAGVYVLFGAGRREIEGVLAEIDQLNGQTHVLSALVHPPRRYATAPEETIPILSYISRELGSRHSFRLVEKLVSAGADVNRTSQGTLGNSLGWCLSAEEEEAVHPLSALSYCYIYSSLVSHNPTTCLRFTELLVESGANVSQDPLAFVHACLRYDVDLVEYLLNHGADANAMLPNGFPVSIVSAGYHCSAYLRRPNDFAHERTDKLARHEKWVRLMRLLLEHGADPTVVLAYPSMPSAKVSLLSAAIASGDVGLSKELLERGAPVVNYDKETFIYTNGDIPRPGRLTPLNECLVRIGKGQEEMLEVFYALLDNGADLNSGGTGSDSYFHGRPQRCSTAIWNPTLLCTVLGCALESGGNAALREVVRVILDKGVDVEEEKYALCLAALTLDVELFEMLLRNGFDTEDCRKVDVTIPTLGVNRFQISEEKMPGSEAGPEIEQVKVNLLVFLLRNVSKEPPARMVLDMATCLVSNGVDMHWTVGPTEIEFPERTNALKVALDRKHLRTATFLTENGVSMQVDENEFCSAFGAALKDNTGIKTAKRLLPHVDAKLLNKPDRKGVTPLAYATSLPMHANANLREPWRGPASHRLRETERVEEETDEQRQQRARQEADMRRQAEEHGARRAQQDEELKELIIGMLDAGASPFIRQRDSLWWSEPELPKVSLFEICARKQHWKQIEIMLEHSASSAGTSEDFVGPLVIALVARTSPHIIEILLDRVDSVLETFVFKTSESKVGSDTKDSEEEAEQKEADTPTQMFVATPDHCNRCWVRSGMSVLTSAGGSRMDNLNIILDRVEREKVPIDTLDANGNTVLSTRLIELPENYEAGLKRLLRAGADPSIRTGARAVSSLMLASARTQTSRSSSGWAGQNHLPSQIEHVTRNRTAGILQLLRERGSLFSTKDKDGMTAFHYACHSGSTELVEWYLNTFAEQEKEENINLAVPKTGMTPTMLVCSLRGTKDLVPKLAAAGADLSAVAVNGHSALSLAVITRASKETVNALLENGADPRIGKHPLIAATSQNPRVWDLIHMLIDNLHIHEDTAQEALNHLLTVSREGDDPYGDFVISSGCGFGARQEFRIRQLQWKEEKESVTEKLVNLGANLEAAETAAAAANTNGEGGGTVYNMVAYGVIAPSFQ